MQRLPRHALKLGFGWSFVLGSLGALPVQAQYKLPAPVSPPAIGALPAPIQSAPSQSLLPILSPVTPGAAPNGLSANAMSRSALTVPVVMKQLLSHQMSAQQAWDKGALTVDDLWYIFSTYTDDWGGLDGNRDLAVRHALAALLVEHGGVRLEPLAKVPLKVRLWLADYYESIHDEKTVALAQSVLSEINTPIKGENPLVIQAVERLGWYYRDAADYEHAAETFIQAQKLYADSGWWVPDSYIVAARMYKQAGDEPKAQALYAQVAQYHNGWFTGLMLYDQSRELIKQRKYGEARSLLQQPVDGSDGDQAQVGLLSLLGFSYYCTGEWDSARKYSQQAITQYKSLQRPRQGAGIESQVNRACQTLADISQWTKTPLVVEPQEFNITEDKLQAKVITCHLYIKSFHAIPFSVNVDTLQRVAPSKIKVRSSDSSWPGDDEGKIDIEKEVIVEIASEALKTTSGMAIVVQDLNNLQRKIRVPLRINSVDPKL